MDQNPEAGSRREEAGEITKLREGLEAGRRIRSRLMEQVREARLDAVQAREEMATCREAWKETLTALRHAVNRLDSIRETDVSGLVLDQDIARLETVLERRAV